MNKSAIFRSPQTINYGRNAFKNVGKEAVQRGEKALIISDKVIDRLGYVSKCRSLLEKANVKSSVYLGIQSEPSDVYVEEALSLYEKDKCDFVISLGGGSCIDTAKAVAVVATNGGYIGDYMSGKKRVVVRPLLHIAIPTTAGTGSEVTDVTVISNTATDVKMMIKQPALLPEVAIVDPLLTISAPKHVTAATGIDALSHAIEAYISKHSHPMTNMMALSAMELIVNNIVTAFKDGKNIEARESLSLGSLQAGLAFSNASVGLVHGMSRPIGALFHIPHGYSNAMLLPAVLEFCKEFSARKLADLGKIFNPEAKGNADNHAATIAVASVKNLCKSLKIPNLCKWGVDKEEFESAINKMATDALASGSPQNYPKTLEKHEIEELYRVCYNYKI